MISLFLDGRVLYPQGGASDLDREFQAAGDRRGLLRLMLGLALASKPAVGRLRDFAVERSGEHRGRLDPDALSPTRRRQLRDAFREVRKVQKKLGRQLSGELAFA